MEDFLTVFEKNEDITPLQMAIRTAVIFITGIILVRLSGRRSFSMNVSMDNVITLLIGGILTRGVDGKTPFLGVLASAATTAFMYRTINWMCIHNKKFGRLIKGEPLPIYKDGTFHVKNMKNSLITEADVEEVVRLSGHQKSYESIEEMHIERDGQISFIKKEKSSKEVK